MISLTDVTFTIPVKFDSNDRKRNLATIVGYLLKNFNTNIIILEDGPHHAVQDVLSEYNKKYTHIFVKKTNNDLMHRTMYLNFMAKEAKTPIIVNYDTDVLLPIDQYVKSVDLIRNGIADGVYPYAGKFINIEGQLQELVIKNKSLMGITESSGRCLAENSYGGCVFWNKDKFIQGGMENENFISWGPEDLERYIRFTKMGYKIQRIPGVLYHLNHQKSLNSANMQHSAFQNNEAEYQKVKNMHPEELKNYIKSWKWMS